MPKAIFIGLGGAPAACTGRRSYRMIPRFVGRELWMMLIPPTSVVRGDKAIVTPLFVAAAYDRLWHIAASDVCDRVSGVGESGHRIPGHPCQTERDANIRTSAEILLCSIAARTRAEMEAGRSGPKLAERCCRRSNQ